MRVTLFDYGAGNMHSIAKALAAAGAAVDVESDAARLADAELIVLPGVGAFAPAAARLAPHAYTIRAAVARGVPMLGICLGMQLLFESSSEGRGAGLGILEGTVERLAATRVPQIGWNQIETPSDPLFTVSGLETAYYANSFVCRPADARQVIAWSTHEQDRFPAAVRSGSVVGVQFHPEKSSARGLGFLASFLQEVAR